MPVFSLRRNPPDAASGAPTLAADQLRRRGRLARVGRYVLWASIACGPVALVAVVPLASALGQPVVQAAPPAPTVIPAPTGYAEVFVDLWLRSSAQSTTATDAVHSMAPGVDLPQPSDKTPMSVQRVVAVRSQPMGGRTWLVTVAATIKVTATADAADSAQPSQQPGSVSQPGQSQPGRGSQQADSLTVRYYAVPVSMVRGASSGGAPDALAVTSVPAQVAGPLALSGSDGTTGPYGTQVQQGPLQQAVSEYLTAYLSGVGESSRYLSPGVKIPPAGAVYRKVELQTLSARTTVPVAPADGAVLDVLAEVRATDAAGQWPLAYPLQLKARAGRWEIAAVAPAAPAASPSSSASPAAPAPTASHEVH
ncbi:conjugal transfer protein [Streptomyces sp. NRRL B-24484]|uniref:conjugal transfer protein n=1 Tax=Streptomyces sp. NRRL B-24484 TaxID=1463833 RepID=UPI00069416E9|nr:conjugal transfer protein [Streptomyces sp. NRRL B-24484]